MISITRLFALSALTFGTAAFAHATAIGGIMNIEGNDNFQSTTAFGPTYHYELSFHNAIMGLGNTGAFAILPANSTVTLFPTFAPGEELPFNQGFNTVPGPLVPLEVLTVTGGGETFDFYMNDYTAYVVTNILGCSHQTCLDITGDGYFTGSGVDSYTDTPGSFTFTTQETSAHQTTMTTFSATGVSVAPEPSSLVLLGTGLMSVAGLARRRFMGKPSA